MSGLIYCNIQLPDQKSFSIPMLSSCMLTTKTVSLKINTVLCTDGSMKLGHSIGYTWSCITISDGIYGVLST